MFLNMDSIIKDLQSYMTFYELMNIGRSNVKCMVLGRKDFTHKTCLLLGKQSQPLVRRSSRGCGSGCSLYLCSVSSLQLCSEFRPGCVQAPGREAGAPVASYVDRDRTGSPWRLQRQIRSQALPCCCTETPGCQLVRDLNEGASGLDGLWCHGMELT